MATQTTNYGLIKPDYEDTVDIGDINDNMDVIDAEMDKTVSSLAIVERGDTASQNIANRSYVIWKGNLYTAKSAISSGDALGSSNLQAVSGGALNTIGASPSLFPQTLSSEISIQSGFQTESWGWVNAVRIGKILIVDFYAFQSSSERTSDTVAIKLTGYTFLNTTIGTLRTNALSNRYVAYVRASAGTNELSVNYMSANTNYYGQIICVLS